MPQVRTLNMLKVELDHLRRQRELDSSAISGNELLNANMREQLSITDGLLKDQAQQVTIYRDLASACQGQERKSLIKLTQIKTQRNILGYGSTALVAVIFGIIYFR